MMDPKNPKPMHPMALAAAEEQAQIEQMLSAPQPPVVDTPPAAPAGEPGTISAPIATPTTPAAPAAPAPAIPPELEQRFEAMFGRVEKLNEDLKREQEEKAALRVNQEFLAKRAQELADHAAAVEKRNKELEAALEIDQATKQFTSELVDQSQFAEIFRGLAPHLRKRDEMIQNVLERNAALEKRLEEMAQATRQEVSKLDQKWLDRTVLRQTPDIRTMLQSKQGQEFLAQRIPGARRTRLQELQDAYRDGDDTFIASVVEDWKRLGAPVEVPAADPQRTIINQQPKAPSPELPVTDEEIQSAFNKVLAGEMSRDEFRKLTARQNAQARAGASK